MEINEILAEGTSAKDMKKWYQGVSLDDADLYISANLKSAVRSVIAVGYYLKCIRDGELFREAGYHSIWEYAQDRYGFSISTASRYMARNDKFSRDGNSPILADEYKDFSKSQLQEMLSLDEEQLKKVTPDMTVQQIREMKKPKEIPYMAIPGQVELSDFPGITPEDAEQASEERMENAAQEQQKQPYTVSAQELLPDPEKKEEESVATSQEKTGKCLHRPDFDCSLEEVDKRNQGDGEDCTHSCCWECAKHGDCRLECYASAKMPGEDAAKMQQNPDERCEKSSGEDATEQLSAYGTPKKVYPADSLIATEACEDGHYCFSCAMECQIRGEERYCREAPMGNPFPCETMNILGGLREKVGNMCQFINHDLADIKVVGNEPNPCCKNCEDPCEYMCCRAKKDLPADPEEKTEEDTKEVIDGEFQEIATADRYTPQYFLQEEQKKLNDLLEAFKDTNPEDIPQKLFLHQKIIVAALAAMVCDLENEELKKQLEEEKPQQPELPKLKNNDQRAAFVDAYKTWPIWIETKETGERYYRYELPDAAMVVKVYYHKCFDYNAPASGRWEDRYHDDWGNPEYYLELDGKYFRDCLVNRSALIDYLKEIQKSKR